MNTKPALRFDAREIAVIFSLFIFVSLLMFTVGILVGKGLTQARYEGKLPMGGLHSIEPLMKRDSPHSGASVSLGASRGSADHSATGHDTAPATDAAHTAVTETDAHEAVKEAPAEKTQTQTVASTPALTDPIKLIPLKTPPPKAVGTSLSDPAAEAEALLKNPKILSLIEPETGIAERKPAATPSPVASKSTYNVQVGSYPNEKAASERVDALKKMGFPQAFFSAKELGSANGTWYRVWLGNYPDYQSAKKTGDQLQARGEVKGYIVRKAE